MVEQLVSTIDGHREWLAMIGIQLNEWLTRSGHLIAEDITFVESILCSQTDISAHKRLNNYFNNNYFTLSFCLKYFSVSTLITGIWFSRYEITLLSSVQTLLMSSLIAALLPIASKLYKSYLSYSLKKRVETLSAIVLSERDLLRKYFKLIEDNEVIERSDRMSTKIVEMKRSFRHICRHLFESFRDATIALRTRLPLKVEIDDELNYLCCLPSDAFEKFETEEHSDLTINLLKSLLQLMRLQQSEFFRRLICTFMSICWSHQNSKISNLKNLRKFFTDINNIIKNLNDQTEEIYAQLYSSHSCANSLWMTMENANNYTKIRKTSPLSVNTQLIDLNRSVRRRLLTVLSNVDDCDIVIQDNIDTSNKHLVLVNSKLDSINGEIKIINDLIRHMEIIVNKIVNINNEINVLNEKHANPKNEDVKHNENSNSVQYIADYIVTDQVFEAFVSDDCGDFLSPSNEEDNESWEYRLKLAQEAEASNNLYRELKLALKSKATEHKIREAKAQGIEIDEFNDENTNANEDNTSAEINEPKRKFKNRNSDISESQLNNGQNEIKDNLVNNDCRLLFTSQIASIAALKGRSFGVCDNIETFGDYNDEQSCSNSDDVSDD